MRPVDNQSLGGGVRPRLGLESRQFGQRSRPGKVGRLTGSYMSLTSAVDVTELIDQRPLGALQIRIIVLCGLVALLDGFDLLAIGVAAPAMSKALQIPPNQLGTVFSSALFGLMAFWEFESANLSGRPCFNYRRWPSSRADLHVFPELECRSL
jgi:hypothetical protein